jgi:acetyl esterase/lipase
VEGIALRLNVFYLLSTAASRPAAIMLHGGAWIGSSKDALFVEHDVVTPLVRAGFVVFTPDYRLSPRYPFPDALQDAQAAIAWVRGNARRFAVDPSRIALWGGSAGGNLASMVATLAVGTPSSVSAVVSWSGIYSLPLLSSHPDRNYRYWLTSYLGCLPSACPAWAAEASPITHVAPDDPPMLLFTSRFEGTGCRRAQDGLCREPKYLGVPPDQARAMASALRAQGDLVNLVVLPGHEHSREYESLAMGRTLAFFESELDVQLHAVGRREEACAPMQEWTAIGRNLSTTLRQPPVGITDLPPRVLPLAC